MQFEGIAAALADAGQAPARPAEPVPRDRRGRDARHAPPGDGGGWKAKRIAAVARRSLQKQGDRAAPFRRELKAAGRGHRDAPGFADDGAKPAVAKPFFHQREQFGIVPRLGIEDAFGIEPRLIKARREQVARACCPKDWSFGARGNCGDEQDRRGVVAPARALTRDFMQCIQPKAFVGKPLIHLADAERQHRAMVMAIAFNGAQHLAQLGNGRW